MFFGIFANVFVLGGFIHGAPQHLGRLQFAAVLCALRRQDLQERMCIGDARPTLKSIRCSPIIPEEPDDDFVRKVLGDKSPEQVAAEVIDGTRLDDLALRTRLVDADLATIEATGDPMIRFALAIDPELRAALKDREDGLDAALTKYRTQLARARFRIKGTSSYPDATFTLRLSYGSVAGYDVGGRHVDPVTYVDGLYARATGADPFQLPPSWMAARTRCVSGIDRASCAAR